jgi:hypothetical protein
MKVKCPYCKRPLQIPYEKIKQRVLDENPPSYGPWIAAIVAGIGIAGALGLVGGTILTKSKEQKAQILMPQLQERVQRLTRDLQAATAELNEERNKRVATAKLKEEIEKKANDLQAAIRERQQVEPRQIPRQSISSQLDQRDLSNIRTLQPDDPRFPIARNSRGGLRQVPVPNSDQANQTPDRPASSVIQKSELITFLPGKRASGISVSSGTNAIGIPQYKTTKAPRGFYFHIVESRVNTLAWPKENIEFDERDGVNIKSTDIVLETTNGKRIHPSYASYGLPADPGSKKVGFAPGPLRSIALVYGRGAIGNRPAGIMQIYVARPGPRGNLVEVEEGGTFDPDRKAYPLYFAFSVPTGSQVKAVGLSENAGAGTNESQTRSRSQTTPPAERNRSIETPLGTIDISKVTTASPKRGGVITVGKYELRRNHVLVTVPVTTKEKRPLTTVSNWCLVSIDGRKCPLIGVRTQNGKVIIGIGGMSANLKQTNEFLFDVPMDVGPLDLYIGARNFGQVFSKEISPPRSTPRQRGR